MPTCRSHLEVWAFPRRHTLHCTVWGPCQLEYSGIHVSSTLLSVLFCALGDSQVFNEINSREMEKINVFKDFFNNNLFLAIIAFTSLFQVSYIVYTCMCTLNCVCVLYCTYAVLHTPSRPCSRVGHIVYTCMCTLKLCVYCTVLYCTVLYCICTVLYCTVLYVCCTAYAFTSLLQVGSIESLLL